MKKNKNVYCSDRRKKSVHCSSRIFQLISNPHQRRPPHQPQTTAKNNNLRRQPWIVSVRAISESQLHQPRPPTNSSQPAPISDSPKQRWHTRLSPTTVHNTIIFDNDTTHQQAPSRRYANDARVQPFPRTARPHRRSHNEAHHRQGSEESRWPKKKANGKRSKEKERRILKQPCHVIPSTTATLADT